ncbi:MAG TPA: MHYT domain-containing protein [Azospirillaceae bacterium]|nr:MHYT domain-containing protein [Azospirillaceae bacterium]
MHDHILHAAHDPGLVVLSVAMAMFASYAALDLAERIHGARRAAAWAWTGMAALAMGGGIWSMHFIAMLAFRLPVSVAYGGFLTALSFGAAVVMTGVALAVIVRGPARSVRLFGGGALMGSGVGTMHYVGMAAMEVPASLRYEPGPFAASLLIAVVAATAALYIAMNRPTAWRKVGAAVVMGFAIAGMHFTGMAAAVFEVRPDSVAFPTGAVIDQEALAGVVAVTSAAILLVGLVSASVDRRFSALTAREAEALRRSEQRFRALIEQGSDLILVMDADLAITYAAASARKVIGMGGRDLPGRSLLDLAMPGDRAALVGRLRPLVAEMAQEATGEVRIAGADGTTRDFEYVARDLRADEAVGGLVLALHDITERKRAAAEMQAAMEVAREANRVKTEFLASMSHELRTPLHQILGYAEIMMQQGYGPLDDPRYVEDAVAVHDGATRLLVTLNSILEYTRIEARQVTLRPEPTDLARMLESLVSRVRPQAAKGRVELVLEEGGAYALRVDERKLRLALGHLLDNAVRFTPAGGRVAIRAMLDDGIPLIRVVDTGIGIAPEMLEKVRKPFVQSDATLTRKYEGAGLGLAIAAGLVDLHGGRLEIESTVGQGTVATVRLTTDALIPKNVPAGA